METESITVSIYSNCVILKFQKTMHKSINLFTVMLTLVYTFVATLKLYELI